MLFMIETSHSPEHCPVGYGADARFMDEVEGHAQRAGVRIIDAWVPATGHGGWYLIDAASPDQIATFTVPLKRIGMATAYPVQTWQEIRAWMQKTKTAA